MAIKTFGTTVTVATIAVGGLTSVEFSGGDVNNIDTTNHSATGRSRTFCGGLTDHGTCELSGDLIVDDVGQLEIEAERGNIVAVVVTYPGVMTRSFSAVVGKVNTTGGLDDKVTFSVPLKITGVITDSEV